MSISPLVSLFALLLSFDFLIFPEFRVCHKSFSPSHIGLPFLLPWEGEVEQRVRHPRCFFLGAAWPITHKYTVSKNNHWKSSSTELIKAAAAGEICIFIPHVQNRYFAWKIQKYNFVYEIKISCLQHMKYENISFKKIDQLSMRNTGVNEQITDLHIITHNRTFTRLKAHL